MICLYCQCFFSNKRNPTCDNPMHFNFQIAYSKNHPINYTFVFCFPNLLAQKKFHSFKKAQSNSTYHSPMHFYCQLAVYSYKHEVHKIFELAFLIFPFFPFEKAREDACSWEKKKQNETKQIDFFFITPTISPHELNFLLNKFKFGQKSTGDFPKDNFIYYLIN